MARLQLRTEPSRARHCVAFVVRPYDATALLSSPALHPLRVSRLSRLNLLWRLWRPGRRRCRKQPAHFANLVLLDPECVSVVAQCRRVGGAEPRAQLLQRGATRIAERGSRPFPLC